MKIVNRNYSRNFIPLQKYEAGIVLSGAEVKAIRKGNLKLENAFVKVTNSQAVLYNAEVSLYQFSRSENYNPTQPRKLLLHKKEIEKIKIKVDTGGRLTVIPTICYNKGRNIKIEIAVSKAKGEIAKKKIERQEDIKLAQQRMMKEYIKK